MKPRSKPNLCFFHDLLGPICEIFSGHASIRSPEERIRGWMYGSTLDAKPLCRGTRVPRKSRFKRLFSSPLSSILQQLQTFLHGLLTIPPSPHRVYASCYYSFRVFSVLDRRQKIEIKVRGCSVYDRDRSRLESVSVVFSRFDHPKISTIEEEEEEEEEETFSPLPSPRGDPFPWNRPPPRNAARKRLKA